MIPIGSVKLCRNGATFRDTHEVKRLPMFPKPENNKHKGSLLCFIFSHTRLSVVFLRSGIVALIKAPPELQVMEPDLQECVDVTCCTEIGQANKCVLERSREMHTVKDVVDLFNSDITKTKK